MRTFRFKLERILSLRKHKEREWEIKLAGATGDCVRLNRDIEEREGNKILALQRQNIADSGTSDILANHLYMSRMDQEAEAKRRELAEAERAREEVQAEYLEASRDRKVLDKLKEKRSEGYRSEQRIEEAKETDDINTGRAGRKAAWQDARNGD